MLSLWFLAVGQQRPAEPQRYGPEAQDHGEPDPSELWDGEEELVGRQFFDPTHPEFDPGWEPHLPTVVDADEVTGLMYDDLEPQHPLKGLYDVPDAPQPPTLARATSTTLSVGSPAAKAANAPAVASADAVSKAPRWNSTVTIGPGMAISAAAAGNVRVSANSIARF